MSNAGDADKRPAGSLSMAELVASLPPSSGGLSAADRAGLVNVLKDKIQSLAGQSSGYLESLPKKSEHDELEAKFNEEKAALEAKYAKLYTPVNVKVGRNFKSVTIDGEVFSLGDCVQYLVETKGGYIGKIVKLLEKQGKEMCRIRRFFSPSEISPTVKGLDYTPEAKELFLASGDGPGVEMDMSLEMVAGRFLIFCTAEESLNEVPSEEQVAAADYFFRRGYDPEIEEVVGLDCVEEAIGAQKVYNKKEWLLPADKIPGRSSSEISASKMPRPSSAVSGSSSHEGAAKGTFSSVPEVSPAPSKDSAQPKLKVRKSDSLARERHDADFVENGNEKEIEKEIEREKEKETQKQNQKKSELHLKGEMGSMPTTVQSEPGRSERLVFAIPAPAKAKAKVNVIPPKPEVAPIQVGKPPVSSKPMPKAVHLDTKSEPLKASRPSIAQKLVVIGAKDGAKGGAKGGAKDGAKDGDKDGAKDGAAVMGEKKRKKENVPSEVPLKTKIIKLVDRANISGEGERPFKVQERESEGIANATSHGAEKVPRPSLGHVFKRKVEEWDATALFPAIQANRVLLLKNLVTGLNSDDLSEALTEAMRCRCEVRIIPPVSFSFKTTMALLRLTSSTLAEKVRTEIESNNVLVANRLVTVTFFRTGDFKAISKVHGHLEFQKENRDFINEDYRDALATSHFAQGNTIEFDYGLPWRVLDEQHEEQWRMLQVELNKKPQTSTK